MMQRPGAAGRVVPCTPIRWPFLCRVPRSLCTCLPAVPADGTCLANLTRRCSESLPTSRTSAGRLGSHFKAAPPTQPARQRRRCRLPERTARASGPPRVSLDPPPARGGQVPLPRRREALRPRGDLRRIRARCPRERIPRRRADRAGFCADGGEWHQRRPHSPHDAAPGVARHCGAARPLRHGRALGRAVRGVSHRPPRRAGHRGADSRPGARLRGSPRAT